MKKRRLYLFFSFKFIFFSSFVFLILRLVPSYKLYTLLSCFYIGFSVLILFIYLPFFCRSYKISVKERLYYSFGVFIKRVYSVNYRDICATERKAGPFLYVFSFYRLKIYCKGLTLYIPCVDESTLETIEKRGMGSGN